MRVEVARIAVDRYARWAVFAHRPGTEQARVMWLHALHWARHVGKLRRATGA